MLRICSPGDGEHGDIACATERIQYGMFLLAIQLLWEDLHS